MKLKTFRVQQFRSIKDSGEINLAFSKTKDGEDRSLTALVGRNESGKSNLLLALQTLNPTGGVKPLTLIKDFPRDRHQREWDSKFQFLKTTWELEPDEIGEITRMSTAFDGVTTTDISRDYHGDFYIAFDVTRPGFNLAKHSATIRKLVPVLRSMAKNLGETDGADELVEAINALNSRFSDNTITVKWCVDLAAEIIALRGAIGGVGKIPSDEVDELLADLEQAARLVVDFFTAEGRAREYVRERLPRMVYVAEFPELSGHQDLDELLNESHPNPPLKRKRTKLEEKHINFYKMAKVAGFDPKQLVELGADGHEDRGQILNRAGFVITKNLMQRWKDRPLKVHFNLDGVHLDTLVSDPNAIYDVKVNLDERSRGLKWFFTFYVTFTADTMDGGDANGAMLLLDEPGLFLHAMSQADLLNHLKEDFANQIIYTTHSPFMIPPDDIASARTVNIDAERGTVVTNDPSGDERTMFPLQAALGWNLAQSLFVGPNNLLVEGVTDFWILSSVSGWLNQNGGKGLPSDLAMTPVGGAGKMTYMAALLSGQQLTVFALLDGDNAGRAAAKELVQNKFLPQKSVFHVSDAFAAGEVPEADVEDLIDPDVYVAMVRLAYAKELGRKKLALNDKIPRIVKRYEMAFKDVELEFDKVRVARRFLTDMSQRPKELVTAGSQKRFEKLFDLIKVRLTTS